MGKIIKAKIIKVIDELVSAEKQDTIVASPEISPRLEYILELSKTKLYIMKLEKRRSGRNGYFRKAW